MELITSPSHKIINCSALLSCMTSIPLNLLQKYSTKIYNLSIPFVENYIHTNNRSGALINTSRKVRMSQYMPSKRCVNFTSRDPFTSMNLYLVFKNLVSSFSSQGINLLHIFPSEEQVVINRILNEERLRSSSL